jgi:hypothetical protein
MSTGASVLSSAQLSAFFKRRYPQRKIEDIVEFDKPTLKALPKSDELTGELTVVPMQLDSPQGISSQLGHAIGNVSSSVGRAWQITPASLYAALTIDAKTMLASRNDQGAFFKTREREYESILEQIGQHNEMNLWNSGSGSLGQCSADPGTGTTVTLSDVEDAINFHEGQVIVFYDNSGGDPDSGTPHDAGGPYTVSAVNYDTGVITFSGALNADIEIDDHLVREGTVDALFKGIPAWIPAADPTDTLFGVARTNYPQKLGGFRQSWLGSIEESVKQLDATMRRFNNKPKVLWLSYSNFNRLDLELGARGYRVEDGGKGTFGRMKLMMSTPGGGVEVKAGPYVPEDGGWLLDMSTWKICTLGPMPHLVQDDGLAATRLTPSSTTAPTASNDGDGIEIRMRQFAQLVCTNPFANGRVAIV